MKIAPAVAASVLLVLSGCAATSLKPRPAAVATGGAYSCWQERLADDGTSLTCNWAHSMADACDSTNYVSLAKSSVSATRERSHRCENGQWLVTVTTR